MKSLFTPRFWLALTLVAFGVILRVMPHPWNFAPIGAIALFAGAHFERRAFGVLIPLAAMFLGDLFVGLNFLTPAIYATYALIAAVGMLLRERRASAAAVGGGVLLSSVLFFLLSNVAMWALGTTYAKTAAGLVTCYVAAIPYFGNTIVSDALFTAILFGAFAAVERRVPRFA